MNADTTPPELRGVESLLDALARSERNSAPAGLGQRVFEASAPMLAKPRGGAHSEPKTVIARITPASFRLFTPLRAAAGLALAAAVGAAWLSGVRTPGDPVGALARSGQRYEALDSKVDSLLAWNSPMGEGFEGLGEQIDLLYADLTEFSIGAEAPDDLLLDGGAL